MSLNLNEAKAKIKKAGQQNVRVVPMPGSGFNGDHQIEIRDNGTWCAIVTGLRKAIAESIVQDQLNRTILG